jgi:uncharacterized membrane protein
MLPAPDDLDRYARHLPDAPERLLTISEREGTHRHRIESHLASVQEQTASLGYANQKRHHIVAFVLGLAYLAVMAAAITAGHTLIGTGGAVLGAAAILSHVSRGDANSPARGRAARTDDR